MQRPGGSESLNRCNAQKFPVAVRDDGRYHVVRQRTGPRPLRSLPQRRDSESVVRELGSVEQGRTCNEHVRRATHKAKPAGRVGETSFSCFMFWREELADGVGKPQGKRELSNATGPSKVGDLAYLLLSAARDSLSLLGARILASQQRGMGQSACETRVRSSRAVVHAHQGNKPHSRNHSCTRSTLLLGRSAQTTGSRSCPALIGSESHVLVPSSRM